MHKPKVRMKHKFKRPIGMFTNFPTIVHGIAEAVHNDPPFKVQRAAIQALRDLNGHKEEYPISVSGHNGTYRGTLGFEVGVAEGIFFNCLDDENVQRLCRPLSPRSSYRLLDFLLIVTYHYSHRGRMTALNFDHHHLRFVFNYGRFEVRLFHSKGTRRMPFDELLNRVFDKIREKMWQSSLGGLTVKYMRML
jgi:hypothetical protein